MAGCWPQQPLDHLISSGSQPFQSYHPEPAHTSCTLAAPVSNVPSQRFCISLPYMKACVGGVSAVPWTFLSEIPQLATNEEGKARRTRMSIVRLLSSTAPTLRHLSCAASGDGQECPSHVRSLCGNRRETDTAKICQRLHDKVGDLSQFLVSGFSAVPCS